MIIVAPADNQSGKGHSIVTSEPVFREDLTLPNGLKAIGLTATPASTVNVAIRNILTPKPDLVVSGINRGYNLGYSAYLSGTVGAAREGAMHGVPAIATSLAEAGAPRDFVSAAEEVLGVARRVKQYGLPPNTFLNVNIPACRRVAIKGYMVTTQAMQQGGKESFAETKHPSGRIDLLEHVQGRRGTAPQGTDIVGGGERLRIGDADEARRRSIPRRWTHCGPSSNSHGDSLSLRSPLAVSAARRPGLRRARAGSRRCRASATVPPERRPHHH